MTNIDRQRSSAKDETFVLAETLSAGDQIALNRDEWFGWTYYARRYVFGVVRVSDRIHQVYGHTVRTFTLDDNTTLEVPATSYLARRIVRAEVSA